MKKLDMESVGSRIKKSRNTAGLTREKFAERVSISPQFLAEIENGKKGISAETLYKICSEFNLSADYILMGKLPKNDMDSPVRQILKKLPPEYIELSEDIILAIDKHVRKSTDGFPKKK